MLSNLSNLRLLFALRCIAISGQIAAILVVTHLLQIPLVTTPLWAIIAALIGLNIYTGLRIQKDPSVSDKEFFVQLLADVTALFGLLYFTGGATNPFASLFILQVIIAAVVLPPFYSWSIAFLTIGYYTILMMWGVEVPYFMHHHLGDFFNLHVQGMWISFMLLALIVAGLVVRMNNTIRRQDALLADAEKMAALGTLAASAAHELGSPLATLSILAEQIPNSVVFKEQLARCKQILLRITAAGGRMRAEGGTSMPISSFLMQLIHHWQAEHPQVHCKSDIMAGDGPTVVAEYTLGQAIRHLLDNAADVSPQEIKFYAEWNMQCLRLIIEDQGPGINAHLLLATQETGITTKEDGLGLGLFLTRSVVQRLNGSLEFSTASDGGTRAMMSIPLQSIAL